MHAELGGFSGAQVTAAALDYSFGRLDDLSEDDSREVIFVDGGHGGVQVCLVRFQSSSLQILAHSHVADAGGAVRSPVPQAPANPSKIHPCCWMPRAPHKEPMMTIT